MKIISSQIFRHPEIVAEKLAAKDFTIFVSPGFELEGETYRVLLDGHHSLEAAIQAGASPEIVEMDSTDHDAIDLIEDGEIEEFLNRVHDGHDFYDVFTGRNVWQ